MDSRVSALSGQLSTGFEALSDLMIVYHKESKVDEIPSFWASDTNTDLPIVSAEIFHGF